MNVFFDTNVIADVALEREPFVGDSRRVFYLAERGRIRGSVSALTFPNVYYIVRKLQGRQAAMAALTIIRDVLQLIPLDEQVLHEALDAGFQDFEDAIQYCSARRADAECLLTRNPGHFPRGGTKVLTPAEFLAAHRF